MEYKLNDGVMFMTVSNCLRPDTLTYITLLFLLLHIFLGLISLLFHDVCGLFVCIKIFLPHRVHHSGPSGVCVKAKRDAKAIRLHHRQTDMQKLFEAHFDDIFYSFPRAHWEDYQIVCACV